MIFISSKCLKDYAYNSTSISSLINTFHLQIILPICDYIPFLWSWTHGVYICLEEKIYQTSALRRKVDKYYMNESHMIPCILQALRLTVAKKGWQWTGNGLIYCKLDAFSQTEMNLRADNENSCLESSQKAKRKTGRMEKNDRH